MAEPARELKKEMLDGESNLTVIGAVNLTAMVDNEVLRHLHTATEYLYVSGMAVDVNHRWVSLTLSFSYHSRVII